MFTWSSHSYYLHVLLHQADANPLLAAARSGNEELVHWLADEHSVTHVYTRVSASQTVGMRVFKRTIRNELSKAPQMYFSACTDGWTVIHYARSDTLSNDVLDVMARPMHQCTNSCGDRIPKGNFWTSLLLWKLIYTDADRYTEGAHMSMSVAGHVYNFHSRK